MKQMRLNLILGLIVLALAATAFFGQKKDAPKAQPLTALKEDAVTKLVLHHANAPDIVLEKKGQDWALTAPVQAAADPFELRSLLGLATAETHTTIDPKDVKLADLGLDPPGFSLTLNDVKVDFGGVEPLNYKRYVMVEAGSANGKIALVDDPPASALDADYSDLVAKELLPRGTRISSISVPGLKLTRSTDGKGWNADPADAGTGSDDLQKFVDAWASARALWNAAMPVEAKPAAAPAPTPAPAAKPGKKAPAAAPPAAPATPETAVVTLEGGATYTFNIAGREPQLALDRPDLKIRYSLAKGDAVKLLKLPPPAPAAAPAADKPADPAPPKG